MFIQQREIRGVYSYKVIRVGIKYNSQYKSESDLKELRHGRHRNGKGQAIIFIAEMEGEYRTHYH